VNDDCNLLTEMVLTANSQYITNFQSNCRDTKSSVLSPILLARFINDVGDHVRNCRFHLYADDLQIYLWMGAGI
jgi:hypothetical protein